MLGHPVQCCQIIPPAASQGEERERRGQSLGVVPQYRGGGQPRGLGGAVRQAKDLDLEEGQGQVSGGRQGGIFWPQSTRISPENPPSLFQGSEAVAVLFLPRQSGVDVQSHNDSGRPRSHSRYSTSFRRLRTFLRRENGSGAERYILKMNYF